MHFFSKKEILTTEIFYLLLTLVITIGMQIIIINFLPKYAALILVFFILILISLLIYAGYVKDFYIYLLIVNFLPLLLLDNDIHYNFDLELLNFIPLLILFIFSISKYFLSENTISFRIYYIELPIILLVIYFGINSLIAISSGRNIDWIINEYFHICLYLTITPILYLFKERKKYFIVLKFLFLISIIISIQYIILNQFIYGSRFVTFQAGFIPLTIGVMFSYFLYSNGKLKKFGIIFVLLILIIGTFVTLTRTLWVTSFIAILFVFLIYLKTFNKLTLIRAIFLLLILIIPILLFKDSLFQSQKTTTEYRSVEYRAQSISKPLEDASFLMRVEASYYAIKRFIERPFFGYGLGDFIKFKFFKEIKFPTYYIDNTWFYFLWKGGAIGFLLFTWLYIRFFKASFFILKNSPNVNVKIICLGLLSGFLALSFLAFLSPLLIKYKTNVLIAFLFAYVEFERRDLSKNRLKDEKYIHGIY